MGTEIQFRGYDLVVDSSDYIYVVGYISISTIKNVYFAKYDTSGVQLWNKTIGSSNYDIGHSIASDSSGNIYITGRFKEVDSDIFLAKYNSSGSLTMV